MTSERQELLTLAKELAAITSQINTAFGYQIMQLVDRGEEPKHYAKFINDHTHQSEVLNKILYTIANWENDMTQGDAS